MFTGCAPHSRPVDFARADAAPARVAGRLELPAGYVATVCGFSRRGVWVQAREPGAAAARYFHITPAILGTAPSSCEIVEITAPSRARLETAGSGGGDFRALVRIVDDRFVVYGTTGTEGQNRALVSCIEKDGNVIWEVEIPAGFIPGLAPDWRSVIAYGNSRDVPMLSPVYRPSAGSKPSSQVPSFHPIRIDPGGRCLTASVAGGCVLWQVYPSLR
ncbi:MAG: hypothetical protein HPY55_03040 [Firmicutes bacterium]|nr:hypothetical protein [Bacillota bacterium]